MSNALTSPEPAVATPAQVRAEVPCATVVTSRTSASVVLHVVLLTAALVVVLLACVLNSPDAERVYLPFLGIPLPPLCQFRYWTGMNCPGCGLTRAFIHLAHGDFAGAWRFNPAAFLVFPLIAVQIPYRLWQLSRLRRGLPEFFDIRTLWFVWIAVGAIFLQWSVRLVAGWLP